MHSWMARRQWIAPLHFAGEGAGGDTGPAAGSGAGSTGSEPTQGGQTQGTGEQPPAEPGPVPYSRFREVNEKAQRLEREQEERVRKDREAKGEHEKIAAEDRTKREAAEAKATRIGRRSAFVSAAAGKVADVNAAATLAVADGMLEALELDDDGNVTKGDPSKVVEQLLAKYAFLKAGPPSRQTGAPLGGAGSAGADTSQLTSQERIRRGVDAEMAALPAHRRGIASEGAGR